ncbi:dienelactone hydrolase domain-containing protein [Basidiobolus meristosporus CBS 931.73]|uniref:Dienelactone hydrolase domain-containing protein n=1 Tax=Basidiobolus meristosporus CBS 931.73 TaxID=1314790 RepID=A0A1Y1X2A7_9FUNG|nr:dienelactone hydrolase domain-containing protein [Basidiobolus meristosporus CBS 931.73]|eukprot:ORX79913.1 dienelactone hydrolase domain-containing protein [Basidiobolus meristosporus CBS 931.73]
MPRQVTFQSQGIKIAGNLYLPKDTQPKKQAAVVVSHPGGGVKEQTSGLYAEKLVELGFIALTFDAAYQGESEGLPRYLEDPNQRVEDIKSAISYLTTLDEVDPERIGALGICASGGYATCAAQTDVRIKAVAGISSADVGELWREGLNGSLSFEDLQKGLQESARQRTREAKGEEPYMTNWVPKTAEDAAALPPRSLFAEAYDYYCTPRAQHPRSTNSYVFRSMDKLVQFSAFDYVHLISPRPVLLIAGTDADTKYFSEKTIEKAKEPKELFLVEGASHVDLYDVLKYVNPIAEKLNQYFTQYLVDC